MRYDWKNDHTGEYERYLVKRLANGRLEFKVGGDGRVQTVKGVTRLRVERLPSPG